MITPNDATQCSILHEGRSSYMHLSWKIHKYSVSGLAESELVRLLLFRRAPAGYKWSPTLFTAARGGAKDEAGQRQEQRERQAGPW